MGPETVSFAPWEAQAGHTNVFGGAFTVRRTLQLHLGRSGGRLSVGPEVHNGNSGSDRTHGAFVETHGSLV
jgi:hypothetical protein